MTPGAKTLTAAPAHTVQGQYLATAQIDGRVVRIEFPDGDEVLRPDDRIDVVMRDSETYVRVVRAEPPPATPPVAVSEEEAHAIRLALSELYGAAPIEPLPVREGPSAYELALADAEQEVLASVTPNRVREPDGRIYGGPLAALPGGRYGAGS